MPTDRTLITLFDLVRRAVAVVDGHPPEPVVRWLADHGVELE